MIVCAFGRIKARQVDTDKGPRQGDRQTGLGVGFQFLGFCFYCLAKLYYDLFKIQI